MIFHKSIYVKFNIIFSQNLHLANQEPPTPLCYLVPIFPIHEKRIQKNLTN